MMKMYEETDIYKGAGERIMLTRIMRGYTRDGLAELAGISSKFLYEIEVGKKGFSAVTLYHISNALSVDSNYILTGKQASVHDQKLVQVLAMFEKNQTERIANILREIYELI